MSEPPALGPGVVSLEHTADVGIEVHAPSLPALFDRAAHGALALVAGADEAGGAEPAPEARAADGEVEERLVLEADDVAGLLALWLRELLFHHEVRRQAYRSATFERLDATRLDAVVRLGRDHRPAVREIKGVTYHGLVAEPRDGGWFARVIFDV